MGEKESYAILMSLDHDIEDVKDEFIKAMVSDFDSKYQNGESEENEAQEEDGSDKIDGDAQEEDGSDEIVGGAIPFGDHPRLTKFATDAQEVIRSYGEKIISSTTD